MKQLLQVHLLRDGARVTLKDERDSIFLKALKRLPSPGNRRRTVEKDAINVEGEGNSVAGGFWEEPLGI